MKKNCESCRTWSDMMARVRAGSVALEAMCLNAMSEHYQQWTVGSQTCSKQRTGEPVDVRGLPPRQQR